MATKNTVEKYLKCLNEIYQDNKRDGQINNPLSSYATAHTTNPNMGAPLQKLGIVKKHPTEFRRYIWIGREPDETMVNELIDALTGKSPKKEKPAAEIISLPAKPQKRKRKELVPIANLLDKVLDGFEIAKKYHIPEDQWKDFVHDLYYFNSK